VTILDALDPQLLGSQFPPDTFRAWRVFLEAAFGLPLSDPALYRDCTGRTDQPGRAREVWCLVGRRGGKSLCAALIAIYLAAIRPSVEGLTRRANERLVVPIIAVDRKQARVIYRFCRGLLKSNPMLASLIENETAECITLSTGVDIEILTCSSKQTRGIGSVGILLDEVCFYRSDESADPDTELVNALLPTMATQPTAMLIAISSPHAKRGVAWNRYQRHYGKPGDVLVWQAPTRVMNPTVPESVIERALEDDPASARSEFLAMWRDDAGAFVSREAIENAVDHGVLERGPDPAVRYFAHCDPSGGSSDSMSVAVSHLNRDGIVVLDCVREVRPPFSPKAVVAGFAEVLAAYNVRVVTGDRWGGVWPAELFFEHGVTYEVCPRTASEGYLAMLPLLNSGRLRLLDHPRLLAQLQSLERRASPSGKDLVSHPRFAHDDLINASALALLAAADAARSDDSQIIAANLSATPQRHGLSSDMDGVSEPLVLPDCWDDFTTAD
jgi:hypothetical protein